VEGLVQESLSQRKSIMNRLDTYGDKYREVPVLIPSEAETASTGRRGENQTLVPSEKKSTNNGKKRKLDNATPDSNSEPKRTPKDPKLPKRPHNAFFYFSQERRPAMQKEFPNLTKKEIATALTQKWNELPISEKAIYIHLQNERKKQYQEIMQQYNENCSSEPLM